MEKVEKRLAIVLVYRWVNVACHEVVVGLLDSKSVYVWSGSLKCPNSPGEQAQTCRTFISFGLAVASGSDIFDQSFRSKLGLYWKPRIFLGALLDSARGNEASRSQPFVTEIEPVAGGGATSNAAFAGASFGGKRGSRDRYDSVCRWVCVCFCLMVPLLGLVLKGTKG